MTSFRSWVVVLTLFLAFQSSAQQGKLIKLPEQDVTLYYEEAGSGRPLVFIPGWTMTTRFFEKQKSYFSKTHRFITMDPRGQGNSEKTDNKHTYEEHARDLHELLRQLDLKDPVLVGWSSGCITLFEYARLYGTDDVQQFIFIDETPKWVGDSKKEWVYGDFEGYKSSVKGLLNGRDPKGVIDWMLAGKASEQEKEWMMAEMLKTPDDIAFRLYIDGLIADHTQTVKTINTRVPSVFLLRESWFEDASKWLSREAPLLSKDKISTHAMFWGEANRFNKLMEKYLSRK